MEAGSLFQRSCFTIYRADLIRVRVIFARSTVLRHDAPVTLRSVEYTDPDGRLWLRGLPDGIPASQAAIGVPIGPPPLDELDLPKDIEIRLHNQLFARGIFTEHDARTHIQDLQNALIAALRADVNRILAVYQGAGAVSANGTGAK